ncbi:hypothetical protein E2C01_077027 [Portunus trituberculatus]|uniref:Uncharacterized protein n=1 Tax=Portunus trituberculatus TaxID=210409 RepID=A0A5B7IL60_PORTR|nr:hypothetical protein [Portunus trituberculatus]
MDSSVLYMAMVTPPPCLKSNTLVLCGSPPSGVYTISTWTGRTGVVVK